MLKCYLGGIKMKKITITIIVALLIVSLGVLYASGLKFGKDLTLKETTKISALLASPADHVNKPVRIEGTIVGVCESQGCWMELASDKEFQKLKIKVNDGDMVFPLTAKGKTAVVEGALYEVKMTKDDALKTKLSCKDKAKAAPCSAKPAEEQKACCAAKAKSAKKVYQFKPYAVLIKE